MPISIHKTPGLLYVESHDGVELPVIDVTNPAFELHPSREELDGRLAAALADLERRARLPAFAQRIMLRFFLRDSILARGIAGARGTYLDGMGTYLLKLGPDNLGASHATAIDRKIADSLPCYSARLRLQIGATLLAGAVETALGTQPGRELSFVNIAGGPASDSLNALLILRRRNPSLLAGRRISIHVLDIDDRAPAFGARSLAALREGGAALEGLDASLDWHAFDWSDPPSLRTLLQGLDLHQAIVAGSSEGGLFEYAADGDVAGVLREFARCTPADSSFMGSLSRIDGAARQLNTAGGAALRLRSFSDFEALVGTAGWVPAEREDCPLSSLALLRRRPDSSGRSGLPPGIETESAPAGF